MTVRTRIAPSPTGIAHIGTAYIALFNYAFAKKNGGEFIIRIEDTDRTRFVEGAEEKIYESFAWLGIPHSEGPDIGGPYAPYRQSERLDKYKQAALELIDKGHAYYCFCSPETLQAMRQEQQQRKEISRYDRRCLHLSPAEIKQRLDNGDNHVVRMKLPDNEMIAWEDMIRGKVEINTKELDDQVLLKSDGFPTYHLAVVVDDFQMKITHIIRGEEWITSTPKHILLYRFFGWELPQFAHMPLLRNPDKTKMSKRKNDVSIPSYREKGFLPEALSNYLCLLGWSHPEEKDVFSLDEFIEQFTMERMLKTGPIFDMQKLKWMNGKYIRELDSAALAQRLKPFLTITVADDLLIKTIPLIKDRLEVLSDINELLAFLDPELVVDIETLKKQTKYDGAAIKDILSNLKNQFDSLKSWETSPLETCVRDLKAKYLDWKPRDYFMTIRVATTGFPVTPPLFESMEVLGKEVVLKRLEQVVEHLA